MALRDSDESGDVVKSISESPSDHQHRSKGRWFRRPSLVCARSIRCSNRRRHLTGACVIALGHAATGYSPATRRCSPRFLPRESERVSRWPLPCGRIQRSHQVGRSRRKELRSRPAGAVTAALFLKEFVEGFPWVHLDIAGTAYSESDLVTIPKGPTGVPTGTFVEFIRGRMR